MKTKEIYVEVKRSANYQTYTAGMSATIEEVENERTAVRELFIKCRELCQEQIEADKNNK